MNHYDQLEFVNIGTGKDLTIADLAQRIAAIVGFSGKTVYDSTKPDGTPIKLLDISKLAGLGWQPKISLQDGIHSTYQWFLEHEGNFREK